MKEVFFEQKDVSEIKSRAAASVGPDGSGGVGPDGSGGVGPDGSGGVGPDGSGGADEKSYLTLAVLGREMFHHAFMAVDYFEMKFMDVKSSLGVTGKARTSTPKKPERELEAVPSGRNQSIREHLVSERGDVPGWVLVVLMTTGLVTAIWAVAAPKLNAILKNSLDSMNNIR